MNDDEDEAVETSCTPPVFHESIPAKITRVAGKLTPAARVDVATKHEISRE